MPPLQLSLSERSTGQAGPGPAQSLATGWRGVASPSLPACPWPLRKDWRAQKQVQVRGAREQPQGFRGREREDKNQHRLAGEGLIGVSTRGQAALEFPCGEREGTPVLLHFHLHHLPTC